MGEQWPQQLEKAASEQGGWCEKNLRKKFEGQAWNAQHGPEGEGGRQAPLAPIPKSEGLVHQ